MRAEKIIIQTTYRIGSVLTNFTSRPGPEEVSKNKSSRMLYASVPSIRQNAGRLESYIIRLTKEQLEKAEIEIPSEEVQDPDNIIDRFTKFDKDQSGIDSGV